MTLIPKRSGLIDRVGSAATTCRRRVGPLRRTVELIRDRRESTAFEHARASSGEWTLDRLYPARPHMDTALKALRATSGFPRTSRSQSLYVGRSRGNASQSDATLDRPVAQRLGTEPELANVVLPPDPNRTRAGDPIHRRSTGGDLDKR